MNELIKTLTSILAFLLLTFTVIPVYRDAWAEKTWIETRIEIKPYWMEVGSHEYAGRWEIDGTPTPPGWQIGWEWNGYRVVGKELVYDCQVTRVPQGVNLFGLPNHYKLIVQYKE